MIFLSRKSFYINHSIGDEDTDVVSNLMSVLKDTNTTAQQRRVRRPPGKLDTLRNRDIHFPFWPLVIFVFVTHTRSEVEPFAGVLSELNTTRVLRPPPPSSSSRGDIRPNHQRPLPPAPSPRGAIRPTQQRQPPPIPPRNPQPTTVEYICCCFDKAFLLFLTLLLVLFSLPAYLH